MKSRSRQKQQVLILGDEALTTEYSTVLQEHDYEVLPPSRIRNLGPLSGGISIALELTNLDLSQKKKNLTALDKTLPPTTAILSSSVTATVIEQARWVVRKHRLIGICALPTFIRRDLIEVAPSIHTLESTVSVSRKFFISLGKDIALVQDRIGMVMPRILCQLVNEAMFAVQQNVASPADIDTAMKLGTSYPMGPIEWGERLGFNHVLAVLDALSLDLQEERYRVCPLLKQMAAAGRFWPPSGQR